MTDEDLSDDDTAEGLEMLLGGLGFRDISLEAWENASDGSDDKEDGDTSNDVKSLDQTVSLRPTRSPLREKMAPSYTALADAASLDHVYARAYTCQGYCTPNGRLELPPVRICHAGESRGNIALASRKIRKGETLFTERAAAAAAVDERVRSCRHCFCSLVPASACCVVPHSTKNDSIPLSHLWPVADILPPQVMDPVEAGSDEDESALRKDSAGRIYCSDCRAWFCSQSCLTAHEQEIGKPHCRLVHAERSLDTVGVEPRQEPQEVQAAVFLAIRLLAMATQHYRQNDEQVNVAFLDGLCGSSNDVQALELGLFMVDNNGTTSYTLTHYYKHIVDALQISIEEQRFLSEAYFGKLAAVAARNSVGFRTQSPFKAYYAALLRQAGGWGSSTHQAYMKQLAQALGGHEMLDRGMDRDLDERLAPALAALFPLTARLNHSCDPNAELQQQVFVDCHVDVVASREIAQDEEITISYLGPVRKSSRTTRRRRELRAKYLFECDCSLCLAAPSGRIGEE